MPRGRPRTTPLPTPRTRIREWRERRGLSLNQMSERTHPHVPASTIQRHESGAGVDTRYLEIYARALGVKSEELLPTSGTLNEQERALLGLFNQLAPGDRQRLIKLGHALAESSAPFEPQPDKAAGGR